MPMTTILQQNTFSPTLTKKMRKTMASRSSMCTHRIMIYSHIVRLISLHFPYAFFPAWDLDTVTSVFLAAVAALNFNGPTANLAGET
jgi:hypothetical protein